MDMLEDLQLSKVCIILWLVISGNFVIYTVVLQKSNFQCFGQAMLINKDTDTPF